ncbi:hypothetical protein VNO77_28305 [Canavalia gladiata]|uniref:Uncharacterized protein n=1 Tax=Canavalia gladiata TaxID=3824 RepID=A0AAN9Q4Q9_CANGL
MPTDIITYSVPPKEPDAIKSISSVQMNAQTVKHQILRLRFATLIATNLFAGLSADIASQTAMHRDQDAMIHVSLVEMVESSISMERAKNISV